ncbi:MAG: endolytic transglycosylase MltG [Endomicrobiales bacterium]|nr:endolytic transglycosylase MltG [Endomicrobiales bacterium]
MGKKLAGLVVLSVFFLFLWFTWGTIPSKSAIVTIPEGSSARKAARILKDADLIASETLFLALTRVFGVSDDLKAGIYKIPSRSGILRIVHILAKGKSQYYKVTIPEGYTSAQIAELLESHKIVNGARFLEMVNDGKLEGYLFPETYVLAPNLPEETVIKIMKDQFNRNFTEEFEKRAKELKMTKAKVVTLASIIEKEAKVADERPKISAVFHNRLKKRWYLESCATVLYALGKHKKKLTYKDLDVDSPYNTYKKYGLPPGPICNPGLESIRAALYPENSKDMYFVVGSSGTHVFSRYLKDHINSKKKGKRNR